MIESVQFRGVARGGKRKDPCTVVAQVVTATELDEQSFQAAIDSARNQIAFYAIILAYLSAPHCHGWEALWTEANTLICEGSGWSCPD